MVPQDFNQTLYTLQIHASDTIIQAGTDMKLYYHLTMHLKNTTRAKNSATLQLALQSWLMKAAGPSHNCAQFLRQLYITEKSFFPGCNSMASSSSLSSAIQPTRQDIFSFLYLEGKKQAVRTVCGGTKTLRSLQKMEQSECCQVQTIFQNLKSNHTKYIHTEAALSIPHFLLENGG